HRLVGVGPLATDVQFRSLAGSQHHQTHNALAIYNFAFLRHPDFRAVTTRNPHEHGRRPCMKPQAIGDRNVFFKLPNTLCAARFSIQQAHYTAPFRSIKLSSLALKSTALFCPKPFNFSSIAATSIKRAMSRPGLTGMVTWGTLRPRIS